RPPGVFGGIATLKNPYSSAALSQLPKSSPPERLGAMKPSSSAPRHEAQCTRYCAAPRRACSSVNHGPAASVDSAAAPAAVSAPAPSASSPAEYAMSEKLARPRSEIKTTKRFTDRTFIYPNLTTTSGLCGKLCVDQGLRSSAVNPLPGFRVPPFRRPIACTSRQLELAPHGSGS